MRHGDQASAKHTKSRLRSLKRQLIAQVQQHLAKHRLVANIPSPSAPRLNMLISLSYTALLLAIANAAPQLVDGQVSAAPELEGRQVQSYICRSSVAVCPAPVQLAPWMPLMLTTHHLCAGNEGEVGVGTEQICNIGNPTSGTSNPSRDTPMSD